MQQFVLFAATSVLLIAYYGYALPRFGNLAPAVVRRLASARSIPLDDSEKIGRLAFAGISQSLFCVLLALVLGVRMPPPRIDATLLVLILMAVLLGAAEMAGSGWLAQLVVNISIATSPRGGSTDAWLAAGKGGWIREYRKAIEHLPLGFALGVIVLYVGVEELIFREVLLRAFRPHGDAIAVVASTFFFAAVQAFSTSSWRNAMFPIVGASVVGIVHALLWLAIPNVLPLIVAHVSFFLIAMLFDAGGVR